MRTPESYQPEIDQNQASIASLAGQISKGTPMPLEQRIAVGLATILPALFSKGASAKAGLEFVQQDQKDWTEQDKLNREVGLRTMTSAQEELRNLRNNQAAADRDRTGVLADQYKMDTQFAQSKELARIGHGYNMEEIRQRSADENGEIPASLYDEGYALAHEGQMPPPGMPKTRKNFELNKALIDIKNKEKELSFKELGETRRQTDLLLRQMKDQGAITVEGAVAMPGSMPDPTKTKQVVKLKSLADSTFAKMDEFVNIYNKFNGDWTNTEVLSAHSAARAAGVILNNAGSALTENELSIIDGGIGYNPFGSIDSFMNYLKSKGDGLGDGPERRISTLKSLTNKAVALTALNNGYVVAGSVNDIPPDRWQRLEQTKDKNQLRMIRGYATEGIKSPLWMPDASPEGAYAALADQTRRNLEKMTPGESPIARPVAQPQSRGWTPEEVRAEKARRAALAAQGGIK
jgi:hypothetical protein